MKVKLYAISILSVCTVSSERKLATVEFIKERSFTRMGFSKGQWYFTIGQISEASFFLIVR